MALRWNEAATNGKKGNHRMNSNGRIGMRQVTYGFALAILVIGAAQAEAQTRAYVANTTANVVTVVDTATHGVVGTIAVGTSPTHVAISQDGARAYVTNSGSNSISVIETSTDSVVATIALRASPFKAAVTPTGEWLYVLVAGGVVQVIDATLNDVVASITVGGIEGGDIAVSPDGSRVLVASGLVSVIDTASRTLLESFLAEAVASPDIETFAVAVAFAPDATRAYVGTMTFDYAGGDFSAGGGIVVVDTASRAVVGTIDLYSQPGSIALTPDGGRAYVGHLSTWFDTGYGAGFVRGHSVEAIDTATKTWIASIELGGDAAIWNGQNTAAGLAVTPDRSSVYVSIPRINAVAVIDPSTNAVKRTIDVEAGPSALAIVPDRTVALTPYAIDAVNDNPAVSVPAQAGGSAVASVLANDTLGGAPAALANVTLSLVSSSDPGVTLDGATGAVLVDVATDVGSYALAYRICETGIPGNCDEATVTVNVRAPYVIRAANDGAAAHAGATAIPSVLANDTLGDALALPKNVTLSVMSSSDEGIGLDLANGSVFVGAGTAPGDHALVYRICESASAGNCDEATVTVTIVPYAIVAANDRGTSPRTGGTAVTSVLANDTFDGGPATMSPVTLSLVSSTNAGVTLNLSDGSVSVARGTAAGAHELIYRICETASVSNCAEAAVTVTVNPYVVNAVRDSARASSKNAGTAVANVLANDTIGGVRAALANVTLSFVSVSPANSKIRLDLSDGSVDVLGKTDSGSFALVYRICDVEDATNCSRGTVAIDLSGSGGK
jgi:YVTN family beta-propeller protein